MVRTPKEWYWGSPDLRDTAAWALELSAEVAAPRPVSASGLDCRVTRLISLTTPTMLLPADASLTKPKTTATDDGTMRTR